MEIVVEQLAVRYAAMGCFVDVYNRFGYHVSGKEFDTKHSKTYRGVRIITIPTFKRSSLNAIVYTFLATIRSLWGGYDAYHFHAEGPCAFLWLTRLIHPKKRIVVTIHGLDWQRSKWGNFASKVLLYGERQAVKHADDIIVLSENVKEYFKATYGKDVRFIPNGINRPIKADAKEMTEKWGLKPQEYILFLARIVPEKGLHYLIEAFSGIQTDKKLVIAGGSSHSNEYMEYVFELAKKDERVLFTHFVQGRKLDELFSNAYIFVLPSDIEGMAISLLEAMSYGNCCVVSDIPENTEVVGEYARSFKHGDVDDLRRVLEELLNDAEAVWQYKSQAQEYILNRYNWDDVAQQTVKLYDDKALR